jgi:guanylate kinase
MYVIFCLRASTRGIRRNDMSLTQSLFVVGVSGVSGTGKTTLITELESRYSGSRVITYTTRTQRVSEPDDAYHFVTLSDIQALTDVLWIKENYGNHYAVTMSSFCEAAARSGGIAIIPTITSHHRTLRGAFGTDNYLGIHLLSPAKDELCTRMQQRGEEDARIVERLAEIEKIDGRAIGDSSLCLVTPKTADAALVEVISLIECRQSTATTAVQATR